MVAILIPGTFNPVTNAHVSMGAWILNHLPYLGLKKSEQVHLFYIPSNLSFMKNWKQVETVLSDEQRIHCLQLATETFPNCKISPIEIDKTVDGTTYETVQYFKAKGYEKVFLCMGEDKLPELHQWYRHQELFQTITVILFHRDPSTYLKVKNNSNYFPPNLIFIPDPDTPLISSTQMRDAIRKKDFSILKTMTPMNVATYLEKELSK